MLPDPSAVPLHPAVVPPGDMLRRWRRLQMHVRCALYPDQPTRVRGYVTAAARVARLGLVPASAVYLETLRTLLNAGQDESLPGFWRSVCLEHLRLPLARLRTLIGLHDPLALRAIEAAVQRARDRLPACRQPPR